MSKRFDSLFWAGSFLLCFLLYVPAINGHPIWDDLAFWVYNPDMKYPFLKIWHDFSWPLSMSVQKLMLDVFGGQFWADHVLSLLLHFANSYLVYRLAKLLLWPKPRWIFLLFLFHPANVISVAWMIQIKTLLCFLFAILSFFAFDKSLKHKKWISIAILLFTLSLLSKSASITAPILFFVYAYKKREDKRWLYVAAAIFCAVSLWQAHELLVSPVTHDATSTYAGRMDHPERILQASRFYFWQTLLPLNTAPVKGRPPTHWHVLDFTTPIFLFAILFFYPSLASTLLAGFIILIPFLGFVFAPFMSITWVSDQHLYLALPFFLHFWLSLLNRTYPRYNRAVFNTLLILFIAQTIFTTRFFSNEDRFYRENLRADPGNVTMAFNYANTLAYHDRTDEALKIANGIHERAEKETELQSARYYGNLEKLRMQLIDFKKLKLAP